MRSVRLVVTLFLIVGAKTLSANDNNQTVDTLGCMLEPSKQVAISSPVSGVIETLSIKRGDRIKKGQVLFQLKAGVEKAAIKLAKVKTEFASRKVKRNEELYQDDLLSPHERDEIETELLLSKMELNLKQEELSLRTIKSPISGVVVDRMFDKGEYVTVEPVMNIASLNPLHVDVLLPAENFGKITKGQKLLVTIQSGLFQPKEAEVSIVDPLIDPASGTYRIQLTMDNKSLRIPSGLNCKISLIESK